MSPERACKVCVNLSVDWRLPEDEMPLETMQVLQLPPTFDLSMKQKATASMTARLATERPRLLPGGDPSAPMNFI